ncbi:MAG: tetratricopeptide repeat protein, partial [Planctomycetota bacterium]
MTVRTSEAAMSPELIGNLDSRAALVFEGNKTYSNDQICDALYGDMDVIIAASPTASLDNYIKVLKDKIHLGYLKGGFPAPKVDVSYMATPDHILIRIEEGVRYTKGDLIIEGVSDILRDKLTGLLNEVDAPEKDTSGLSDFLDNMNGSMGTQLIQYSDYETLKTELTHNLSKTFLGSQGHPSFVPLSVKTSTKYLEELLQVLGFYNAVFSLELVPDHAQRTASVHITFQDEGVRPHIETITIIGNEINTDEEILDFLDLQTGRIIDDLLIQNLKTRLMKSGRFRFIEIAPQIDTENPLRSTLTLTLEEEPSVTPLKGKLTDKEKLMLKVGEFMNSYQSWDKDVCFAFELDFTKLSDIPDSIRKQLGYSGLIFEGVYSTQKGLIVSEKINQTQALNTFIITSGSKLYLCPVLNYEANLNNHNAQLKIQYRVFPSTEKEQPWSMNLSAGMGFNTEGETLPYQPEIDFHPACWFHLANDPGCQITFLNDNRATIILENFDKLEMEVDVQSGEVIEIRKDGPLIKFKKGAFDKYLKQLETSIRKQQYEPKNIPNNISTVFNIVLSTYLSHISENIFTIEVKKQILETWGELLFYFDACSGPDEDVKDFPEKQFSLPVDDQLASGGMIPMLLGMGYQACKENLPNDSWVPTLLHSSVLIASGHGGHSSVGQELQLLYNTDQIGPIGYLLIAKFLGQLGYPAYTAFAQRGLQGMSAADFRKDWQPLLKKESKVKEMILCYLEKLQICSDEDISTSTLILPPETALLMEAMVKKLKEVEMEQLHNSLEPVLTDYWEKTGKNDIRQQLNSLIPQSEKKAIIDPSEHRDAPMVSEVLADKSDLQELVSKAQAGDPQSQLEVGLKYCRGQEIIRNYEQAVFWFRKAAEQGYADGQYKLGAMYYYGDGVKQDFSQALAWYSKASLQQHGQATYELSVMYSRGEGVTPDPQKSVELNIQSAEMGFAFAQSNLGAMYLEGNRIEKDYSQAHKWLLEAAKQGEATAQNNLGWMYQNGWGVNQDYFEAVKWYTKAVE